MTQEQTSNAITANELLEKFGAPKTFSFELPDAGTWTVRGIATYAEKRKHEAAKTKWVSDMLAQARLQAKNGDGLLAVFVPHLNLMVEENLTAAYEISHRVISPQFSPVDALRLCEAPALVQNIMDQMTWGSANFLLQLKAELYEDAGKA
jgi:hypothetical protein